ncbi:hypothetical protein WR25_17176 isoform C [Diploscapter pachys]|uniref:Uncharacterized protein n=1 Tax=Diploscapter pachys TaxID=2018661 RepID=A0A2A2LDN4_9BILA|nr:hypothetical protein WR25_17176 isoform B [Diploscapter pachys]PAV84177.1 hypothetical protein WR25_17176 isoform C [Diploscapter pachys]
MGTNGDETIEMIGNGVNGSGSQTGTGTVSGKSMEKRPSTDGSRRESCGTGHRHADKRKLSRQHTHGEDFFVKFKTV